MRRSNQRDIFAICETTVEGTISAGISYNLEKCLENKPPRFRQGGIYGQAATSPSYSDLEGGTHSQAFSAKENITGEAIQEVQTVTAAKLALDFVLFVVR